MDQQPHRPRYGADTSSGFNGYADNDSDSEAEDIAMGDGDEDSDAENEADDRYLRSAGEISERRDASGHNIGNDGDEPLTWFIVKVTVTASIGGVLFGYDMGAIAGVLPQLQQVFQLTNPQQEWVVSILYLGGGLGAMIGGSVCDTFGRKRTILGTDVVFLLGAILLCTSNSLAQILIGRFVVGIAVAISGIADVSYLHECAPLAWRGAIVSVNEACISLGFLLAYLAGWVWSSGASSSTDTNEWRKIFGVAGVLAAFQFVGMWSMPESPVWLRQQQQKQQRQHIKNANNNSNSTSVVAIPKRDSATNIRTKSQEVLRLDCQRRGDLSAAALTMDSGTMRSYSGASLPPTTVTTATTTTTTTTTTTRNMQPEIFVTEPQECHGLSQQKQTATTSILAAIIAQYRSITITCRKYRKQIVIAVFLAVTQQLCGQTNVLNYAPHIFATTAGNSMDGVDTTAVEVDGSGGGSTVTIGIVKFIVTCLVIWKIEKFGRRIMLLSGMATIALGLLCLLLAYGGQHERIGNDGDGDDDNGDSSNFDHSDVTNFKAFHLALPGVLLVVSGYSMSFGPLTWLLTSELFPTDIRGRALGASTIITYLSAAAVTRTFLSAQDMLGPSKVFAFYMMMTLLGLLFAYLAIPDTGERTVDEVEVALCQMPWWRFDHVTVDTEMTPTASSNAAENGTKYTYDTIETPATASSYDLYHSDPENENEYENERGTTKQRYVV